MATTPMKKIAFTRALLFTSQINAIYPRESSSKVLGSTKVRPHDGYK